LTPYRSLRLLISIYYFIIPGWECYIIRFIERIIKFVSGKGIGAESIRYLVVGALTTFVNFGIFELLHSVLGVPVTISNITSISISIIFAYVANKLVVFRRRSDSVASLVLEFCKFVGSRLFTMALEVGAVFLFHDILAYDARLGKIAAQVLVIITNYFISKVIVFRGSGRRRTEPDKAESADKK